MCVYVVKFSPHCHQVKVTSLLWNDLGKTFSGIRSSVSYHALHL